jgi:uncharacterized membrane protein
MNNTKILNLLIAAIALIGGILFIRVFSVDASVIETDVDKQNSIISPLIYFSYYLFLGTVIVTIVLSLLGLFSNKDNLIKTLKGLAALTVLLIIAYILSDSNVVYDAAGRVQPGGEEGSSVNKWVGTGIWYSTILGGIAGLFFVWDLVKGLIKS